MSAQDAAGNSPSYDSWVMCTLFLSLPCDTRFASAQLLETRAVSCVKRTNKRAILPTAHRAPVPCTLRRQALPDELFLACHSKWRARSAGVSAHTRTRGRIICITLGRSRTCLNQGHANLPSVRTSTALSKMPHLREIISTISTGIEQVTRNAQEEPVSGNRNFFHRL